MHVQINNYLNQILVHIYYSTYVYLQSELLKSHHLIVYVSIIKVIVIAFLIYERILMKKSSLIQYKDIN